MSFRERRRARRVKALRRSCLLWMLRMDERRGGFEIVLDGGAPMIPKEHRLFTRFISIIRYTNAPRAIRYVFDSVREMSS
jgi:hypothetical protein